MRALTNSIRFAVILGYFLSALGCSSGDLADSNSAEGAFKAAEKLEADERFEEAVQKYREVQNKHPYSRFAVEAKLRIANVYFAQENFVEAQAAYQVFKELHPKHAQIDYATFRLGLSFFNQLPTSIDRDLNLAKKAISMFDEVVNTFPQSTHVKEAKEKKVEALRMLAEKENYIANFYFIRDQYDSALKRYEKLMQVYPDSPLFTKALYGAAASALRNGDREKGVNYGRLLLDKYGTTSEAEKMRREFDKHGI